MTIPLLPRFGPKGEFGSVSALRLKIWVRGIFVFSNQIQFILHPEGGSEDLFCVYYYIPRLCIATYMCYQLGSLYQPWEAGSANHIQERLSSVRWVALFRVEFGFVRLSSWACALPAGPWCLIQEFLRGVRERGSQQTSWSTSHQRC